MMNLYRKSCKSTRIKPYNYEMTINIALMKNIKELFF
jgi:hypothetical protein